jgi:F0F1-type ATP synthase membrane subunit c/vacuolar-type H+-ATPase subunit K
MRLQRLLRAGLLVALTASGAALLGGCAASSGLVNMWRDPGYNDGPMRHVLVVAVVRNSARRRILEDAFVEELRRGGRHRAPPGGALEHA